MKKLAAVMLAFFAIASSASATGGFSCSIDDNNLELETGSSLGRGMGAPILDLTVQAKLKIKGTPGDLSELDLKSGLVHSWMDHPELRLHFYREREAAKPHGYVELVIMAKATDDDGNYGGDYRLTAFYTEPPADAVEGTYLKATGKVSCFVE